MPNNPTSKLDIKTGDRFGHLTVLSYLGKHRQHRFWLCLCDCGNQKAVSGYHLRNGHTKSCGCFRRTSAIETLTTHGMTSSAEHRIWSGIKSRCYSPSCQAAKNYWARGIRMQDDWRDSFEAFYRDMGPRPGPEYSVERVDNDGPYSKENCVWKLKTDQAKNTRKNRRITFQGKTLWLAEWARITGLHSNTIRNRLRLGWSVEEALTLPPDFRHRKYR